MRLPVLAICLLSFCVAAFSQGDRGNITGTVSDPAGAVVANATIEAKNVESGVTVTAVTTETGNYTLPQLPVGNYELTVTVPGFKKFVQQNLRVDVAQTLRVDAMLEIGGATETVTVAAEASMLKTESGDLSHTVPAERLENLPILGIGGSQASSQGLRSYLAQTNLVPGGLWQPGGLVTRLNGAPANTQSVRIEGMDASNGNNFVQASTQPSIDAVEETTIQTSNYAAEYGQAGGGVFNITMKSGTNQFHAGGFDYLQNEFFNASVPYTNITPRVRRNDWGFHLGGPVRIPKVYDGRDKLFFFYNREQYREFFVVNNVPITVPTDLYRQGNFQGALTGRTLNTVDPFGNPTTVPEGTIFNPASDAVVNGKITRTPFSGNIIPPQQIDHVAAAIQKLIPPASSGGLINNYLPSFPNDRITDNESVKLDYALSSKARIAGYFGTNATGSQYSQQLNASEGLPPTITVTRGTFTQSYTWRANFDYTVSPTVLLHAGAGFLRYDFADDSPTTNFNAQQQLGLVGATVASRFPSINGATTVGPFNSGLCAAGFSPSCTGTGGMASMGPANSIQSHAHEFQPSGIVGLTWVKSNHTYKFGGEFRHYLYPDHINNYTNGLYSFSAAETALPYLNSSTVGGGTIGFPYASFLLGAVDNGNIAYSSDTLLGKFQWAFFAQDTWKVTRKFTLDYGLRWDYSTYLKEQYGRMPTLNPTLANPTAGGQPGAVIFEGNGPGRCNCTFAHNYPYAFGPRLGAAYQITSKTVVRAGFGIMYGGTANFNGSGANGASNNPFLAPAFGEPAMQLQNGIPAGTAQPWPNFNPGIYPLPTNPAGLAGPPVVVDQNAGRPGRQFMWSIGVQREITRNLVAEAAYVGNRGAWWDTNILDNYNANTPQSLAAHGLDINSAIDRALLLSPVGSPQVVQRGFRPPYTGFPLNATLAQALRPFPQFATGASLTTGLSPLFAPQGRTWYDSLQAKLTKRFSHGLVLNDVFTWEKELTMGAESDLGGGTSGVVNDVFNRQQNKYISQYSRPFVNVLAINYTTPFAGSHRALRWLAGGWTPGAVLQYASGLPILAPLANNGLNSILFRGGSPTNGTFANRAAGKPLFLKDLNCHCIDPNKDLVLNPEAWTDPLAGQFGTSAAYYNDYRLQRRPQESVSLAREFAVGKEHAVRLLLRMEFINIFNRTEMNNPASTNASAPTTTNRLTGALTGGFGYINPGSTFAAPRQGTAVMRLTF